MFSSYKIQNNFSFSSSFHFRFQFLIYEFLFIIIESNFKDEFRERNCKDIPLGKSFQHRKEISFDSNNL